MCLVRIIIRIFKFKVANLLKCFFNLFAAIEIPDSLAWHFKTSEKEPSPILHCTLYSETNTIKLGL